MDQIVTLVPWIKTYIVLMAAVTLYSTVVTVRALFKQEKMMKDMEKDL